MLHLIHGFLDVRRNLGTSRALRLAPLWAVKREFVVLLRKIPRSPLPSPPDATLDWRFLDDPGIPALAAINPVLAVDDIRRRLDDGQECEIAYRHGTPVHYVWRAVGSAWLPYLGKTCEMTPGDLFVTELYTHPAYRKLGIHILSVRRNIARAGQLGLRRYFSMVAWWNVPVLRTADTTGAVPVGKVGYWNLGFTRRYFAEGPVSLRGDRVILGQD